MLSVFPRIFSTQNVPAIENAIPIVTNDAIRMPRNNQQIPSTKNKPNAALRSMTVSAFLVLCV